MKITVIRKYRKAGYTIGELWINGERICDTMEPEERAAINRPAGTLPLSGGELERYVRLIALEKARHPKGKTAIPMGSYRIQMEVSSHLHARRAFLMDVPGFRGVMIHEGNKPSDTSGCILVGRNNVKGMLVDSRVCLGKINSRILAAQEKREVVMITVR